MYSVIVFLIFYMIMPNDFGIYEGLKNTVLVLAMTIFLKSAPNMMRAENQRIMYSENESHKKQFIFVMKLLKSLMFGLSIATIVMTIISVVGIYISNVLVNTAHVFALTIPMWLTVREGIKSLIDTLS